MAYNNSEIAETVASLLDKADVFAKDFVLEEANMFLKVISKRFGMQSLVLKPAFWSAIPKWEWGAFRSNLLSFENRAPMI